jgi:coiled-coil domain-containing protein 12
MSSHETLSAAALDRKSRLAQLKSLKRKQAPTDETDEPSTSLVTASSETAVTKTYLSGRNYDVETRGPKLGFEAAPIGDVTQTLEYKAEQLALQSKKEAEEAEKEDKPVDLFKLRPKKPNWDLKRDLEAKLKVVDVWTENAIARLVRERVEAQKQKALEEGGMTEGEGETVGLEGRELVEAMHVREREEEEERKREALEEKEEEEELKADLKEDVS